MGEEDLSSLHLDGQLLPTIGQLLTKIGFKEHTCTIFSQIFLKNGRLNISHRHTKNKIIYKIKKKILLNIRKHLF